MKRIKLENGTVLSFENKKYEITNVLGCGANCIAYTAKRQDGTDFCLKECYPYKSKITRNEDLSLSWADEKEKDLSFKNFYSAHSRLIEMYSINEIRNSTPISVDIFEENGTVYSLSDIKTGKNFEKDNPECLSDIITVGISLSKLIKAYHSKEYLHLDIKPENIFLIDETRETIVLFDVDSIVSIRELENGLVKSISFSKDFSSPEQRDLKIEQIGEQTDFYAIGATLFYKIMGNPVRALDRGVFAEWDFSENKFFENINPRTKKEITYFFKKTLALNPKDRFDDADHLIESLERINELSKEEKYIDMTDSLPATISNFVGREKDLEKIDVAFAEGKKMIFLQGFGGIGKSELAKKYATIHEKQYDEVIFLEYVGSLKDTLNQINIHTMKEASFDEKEADLKKLLTPSYLLIIDNFDIDIYADDYLGELSKYGTKTIFTTRTDFSDFSCEKAEFIDVKCLKKDTLLSLFILESGLAEPTSADENYLLKTLEIYQYHTMFVKPLAYKIKNLDYDPQSLYEEAKEDILENIETVTVTKDGEVTQETLNSLAKKLFKLEGLNPCEKQVLSDLYLLNEIKVDINTYVDVICKGVSKKEQKYRRNAINSIVKKGIVQKSELNQVLSLHPIIMELVSEIFSLSVKECCAIANYFSAMTDDFLGGRLAFCIRNFLRFREYSDFPKYFKGFLSKLDMNIPENSEYALDLIFKICSDHCFENRITLFKDFILFFDEKDERVKLLEFLKKFRIDSHPASVGWEENVVENIVSFYKKSNNGTDLFGTVFWHMVLFYYGHLQAMGPTGWNISLLDKIQECIKLQNESAFPLYKYVLNYRKVYASSAMICACSDVSKEIEREFLIKQSFIKNLGITTKNKLSAETYRDCIEKVCSELKKELLPFENKASVLSDAEFATIKDIYNKIISNGILSRTAKNEFIRKHAHIFVFSDPLLEYDLLPQDFGAEKLLSELLEKDELSPERTSSFLLSCIDKIMKDGHKATLAEHQKLMDCIKDFDKVLEIGLNGVHLSSQLMNKLLFSCFMTDSEKFKESFEKLSQKLIYRSQAKLLPIKMARTTIPDFSPLLKDVVSVNRANELYGVLKAYFENIKFLYEKHNDRIHFSSYNYDSLLTNLIDCAEASFNETEAEFYKKEYNKLKNIYTHLIFK